MIPLIEQIKRLSVQRKSSKLKSTVKGILSRPKVNWRRKRRKRRPLASAFANKFCMMRYKISF